MNLLHKTVCSSILGLALSGTVAVADCTYELFNISSTKNTRIIDFVEQISDECEYSIIIADSSAEKILNSTLNKTHIKNLTIDEVLKIVLNENNLSYTLKDNILKISYLTTITFPIDYILSTRSSTGNTDVTIGSSSTSNSTSSSTSSNRDKSVSVSSNSDSGITIKESDEVTFWKELDKEFQRVLNRPEDVYHAETPIINKNAGLVTVTATDKQMKRFENYLDKLQKKVQLQVLIDVQLIAVTMDESHSTGIDWRQLYALQNLTYAAEGIRNKNVNTWESTEAVNITETGIGVSGAPASVLGEAGLVSVRTQGSINEVIKFLQTQGDVVSLSNPKVLTLNNQPALITAGTEYFYKVKNTSVLAGGSTGSQDTQEEIESVFAGVLLSITPEIADDRTITLKINPSISQTKSSISSEDNSGRTLPPDLDRRQLSSVVTVKDGNKIILGGLIDSSNNVESNGIPVLGQLPILSLIFSYEEKVKQVRELVIIIQPHIIDKDKSGLSLSDLGYDSIKDNF